MLENDYFRSQVTRTLHDMTWQNNNKQHITVHHSTEQQNTTQHITAQHNIEHGTAQLRVQHSTVHPSTVQHNTTHTTTKHNKPQQNVHCLNRLHAKNNSKTYLNVHINATESEYIYILINLCAGMLHSLRQC